MRLISFYCQSETEWIAFVVVWKGRMMSVLIDVMTHDEVNDPRSAGLRASHAQ